MQKKSGFSIKSKYNLVLILIIAGSFLFCFLLYSIFFDTLGLFNNQLNDLLFKLRYQLRGKERISPYIVYTGLTDSTVQKLKLSVWDRKVFADIISLLDNLAVKTIACDLFFQDPIDSENDKALLDAVRAAEKCYFPVILLSNDYKNVFNPQEMNQVEQDILKNNLWTLNIENNTLMHDLLLLPFTELAQKAKGLGHINCIPDKDGLNRRFPLLYRYKDYYIPSLTFRMVCDYFHITPEKIEVVLGNYILLKDAVVNQMQKKDIKIPIDNQARIILNYPGLWNDSFPLISFEKLLPAIEDKETFSQFYDVMEESLVVISDISTRNKDYGASIYNNIYPLAGIHLTVLNMILTENILREQNIIEIIIMNIFLIALLWLISWKFKTILFYVSSISLYCFYIITNILLFIYFYQLPNILPSTMGFLSALLLISGYRFFIIEKEKTILALKIDSQTKIAQAKQNLIQDITHEIKTPLTLILSPLNQLKKKAETNNPVAYKQELNNIERNANKILDLTTEMLNLTKLEQGKLPLCAGLMDITAFLKNIFCSFQALFKQKNIDFQFDSKANTLEAFIDISKMEKVLTNLLTNAYKFTAKGGKIKLGLSWPIPFLTAKYDCNWGNKQPKELFKITIKDTGKGIPEQHLPFIFDRFSQYDSLSPENLYGSGIGLSLVKRYVELHYGKIDVKSKIKQGTKFTILLPLGKNHLKKEEIIKEQLQKNKTFKLNISIESDIKTKKTILRDSAVKYPDQPVFIIDDQAEILEDYKNNLSINGINNILLCQDSTKVMEILTKVRVSVIILDLFMPQKSGQELLIEIKKHYPEIPIIIATAADTVEAAVQCIKNGAFDYMIKPIEINRLVSNIHHCIDKYNLEKEIDKLSRTVKSPQIKNPEIFTEIITQDAKMLSIFRYIEVTADSLKPILITGESGVGKELIARAIYKAGNNKGNFVPVNVAELDEHMFNDTIFGHEKGAFTGAANIRKGLLDEAVNGVIFLDEIGDINENIQAKLLRLLQERTYRRLGSNQERKTNAKFIFATNRDLSQMLQKGKFRKDLYYRISNHWIEVPPLRERLDDLPLLINNIAEKISQAIGKDKPKFPQNSFTILKAYTFPGNIRELETLIEEAIRIHDVKTMPLSFFRDYIRKQTGIKDIPIQTVTDSHKIITYSGDFPTLQEVEDFFINEALKQSSGIKARAARLLGISPFALGRKLKKKE